MACEMDFTNQTALLRKTEFGFQRSPATWGPIIGTAEDDSVIYRMVELLMCRLTKNNERFLCQ